jgi:hypothetical protein
MGASSVDKVQVIAALLAGVVIVALVGRASAAAFAATTTNPGNGVAVGQISLSDDDGGIALFSVSGLMPGQSETRCIEVTYAGSLDPGIVRVFSDGLVAGPAALRDALTIQIEEGPATGTCDSFGTGSTTFNGTVTAFDALRTYDAGGLGGTWDPTASTEMRPYRITIGLPANAPDAVQGAALTGLGFVWETRTAS